MVLLTQRVVPTLLLLVLLSAGLAGCFDKDRVSPQEDEQRTIWRPGDTPLPLEEYQRLYATPAPGSCEGCIPLDTPPSPTPSPPPPPPPPVKVPYPHIGDRIGVRGGSDWFPTAAWSVLPRDDDRRYLANIEVVEGGPGNVGFRLDFGATEWAERIEITNGTWQVSLASRTVTEGRLSGHAWVDEGSGRTKRPLLVETDPPIETLFWLGSHLWGRTLAAGETFSTHWVVPGTEGALLRFDYFVVRAERDGVFTPSHGHASSRTPAGALLDAQVRATLSDPSGNRMQWTMFLDEDSPYPVEMDGEVFTFVDPDAVLLPAIGKDQRIALRDRGDRSVAWGETVVRPVQVVDPADAGFLLGERIAPPVLDEFVQYPLSAALFDLRGVDDAYASFEAENPRRVLISAEYQVQPVTTRIGERHIWQLGFTDGHGGVFGWTVSRLGVGDVLAPLPEEHRESGGSWDPVVEAFVQDPDRAIRLGTGRPAAEALRAHGIEYADHLVYRLRLVDDHTVGGVLYAADHRTTSLHRDAPLAYGHFVEDLASRQVLEWSRAA